MKKKMFGVAVVFAALVTALAGGGCGSSPAAAARVNRPDWVINPPKDDEKIFGMGSANSTNEGRGWAMAANRARTSISFQITAIVKGMQESYTKQAGNDGAEIGQNFFMEVGRQLTYNALNGARDEIRGIGSNGTYYVLVSYSRSSARSAGSTAIQTAAAKDAQVNKEYAMQAMNEALAAEWPPALVETD